MAFERANDAMAAHERIVVTGTGVVTAIGETVPAFWTSLKQGLAPDHVRYMGCCGRLRRAEIGRNRPDPDYPDGRAFELLHTSQLSQGARNLDPRSRRRASLGGRYLSLIHI